MRTYRWTVAGSWIVLATALVSPLAAQTPTSVDVLIRSGLVVDGTGSPGRVADVGIRGDRIVFVGDAARERVTGTRSVDARGLVVVPGFIDPHAHVLGDLSSTDRARRANAAYLLQGVTTTITGNDGGGPVDIGGTLANWERQGIGTNGALFVGFGSLRQRLLGPSSAAANAQQLDSMRALAKKAMADGALGLSTGLYYAPQSYATTEEVIAVAKATAPEGVYDSHIRDESSYTIGLVGAVQEVIRIGKEAGIAAHVAHIKALGVDVWGKSDSVIGIIRAARAGGQRVTADQYPYTASGTSVGASLLPRWAEAGGRDSLRARVADAATRARLEKDMAENMRRRGGAASLLITDDSRADLVGKTLADIAREKGTDPIATAIDIILSGGASVASFNMNERDIANFMRQDFVMTGSDGSGGHPRKYGTYPRKFSHYVFGRPANGGRDSATVPGSTVLSLETAVQRSSALPAMTFALTERGLLRAGYFADVVVIDTAKYAEQATYREPEKLATGVRYVWVNGTLAVEDGRLTDAMAGRALRRGEKQ